MAFGFSYNPKINNTESHLNGLSRIIDLLSSKCKNVILHGNFNSCMEDSAVIAFCETYKLRNLIKQTTCFKNSDNPSSIDLFLTNKTLSFKTTFVIETRLSGFHKIIVALTKMHFLKIKLRVY